MRILIALLLMPSLAWADSLVATRTIRAQSIIAPTDVAMVEAEIPNAVLSVDDALGLEARVTIYAGRPVLEQDIGPPALVDRNQIVTLAYSTGGLAILTEGRALVRGGAGDVIRVMNMSSRTTVSGRIGQNGVVLVGPLGE